MSKPIIVLIPGIGDDTGIYQTFARRFEHFGYETRVIPFGWADTRASLLQKMPRLHQELDRLGGVPLCLVGISAGGTAAVLAMTQRRNIRKVITVCSPLDTLPGLRNPLLAESIVQLRQALSVMEARRKADILSVFGLWDQVVATRLSRPVGIATKRIFGLVHAPTIFIALMFYTRSLVRFLRRSNNR